VIWWALLIGALVVIYTQSDAVRRYSVSLTAIAKGINNTPTDPDIIARLEWMATQEPAILSVLREADPLAHLTSAYRCPELNAAVGGLASSRHMVGLALDFGGLADEVAAATRLRANAARLPPSLHFVYAELTHIHAEFHDPLRKIDPNPDATRYSEQTPGGSSVSLG